MKTQHTPNAETLAALDEAQEMSKARLTNKAGAEATPLEKDVQAWLEADWFRV